MTIPSDISAPIVGVIAAVDPVEGGHLITVDIGGGQQRQVFKPASPTILELIERISRSETEVP